MKKSNSRELKISKYLERIVPSFKDERGTIVDVLEDKNIKHVGIIVSFPGSIRGNHYHKKSIQWTYVIDGKIKLYSKRLKNKNSKTECFVMEPGDIIKLPPLTIHAIEALEKSTLLILTNQSRKNNSYEYDTFRIKIA